MRCLVTGLNGTLAPVLAARLPGVVAWDRSAVDPDGADAGAWLEAQRVDAIAHLANGSLGWTERLARHAAARDLPFVYTSSAMVFDHRPDGPHRPADARTARDGYGRMKVAHEDAVLAAHPGASVVRIGWQIGLAGGGNHMLAALDAQQARDGRIAASRAWTPACSFLDDTADALAALLRPAGRRPGVRHLDANAGEAHAFDRIVHALRSACGREAWRIEVDDAYRHDQRLLDGDALPPLSARLPALRGG